MLLVWQKGGNQLALSGNLYKTEIPKIKSNILTRTILQKIATGDKTAVQDCLDTYGGLVWSLARKMLSNNEDAEDAVQEIFVEVWKNAERYDETKSSEATFIAMIARRRLIDRIRKVSRQPGTDSIDDIVHEPTGQSGKEIYASLEAKRAAAAINDLKPEQQKVLNLSIVHGYSQSEIATALDLPLGTVKTHARRGLMLVREVLASNGPDQGKEVSA